MKPTGLCVQGLWGLLHVLFCALALIMAHKGKMLTAGVSDGALYKHF
jgi:hypothetical protein